MSKPEPRIRAVCSVCGNDWRDHPSKPTEEDCKALQRKTGRPFWSLTDYGKHSSALGRVETR